MTKRVLSKEIDDAIAMIKKAGYKTPTEIITVAGSLVIGSKSSPLVIASKALKKYVELSDKHLLKLVDALTNGYEIEYSPEDVLLKEYKSMNGAATPKTEFGRAAIERRKGFLTALDILGVEVKGVNHNG